MKTQINKMSLDCGMENIKVMIEGRKSVSLVAIAEAPLYAASEELIDEDSMVEYNQNRYQIGNTYAKNNAISVRNFEKYASLMPLIIYSELTKQGYVADENNQIIVKSFRTGVPLSAYSKRDVLERAIKPETGSFTVNGIEIVLEKVNIFVQGGLIPLLIWGQKMPKGFTTIIEIGSRTVEVITIEKGKMINDSAYTKSINKGMNNAYLPLKSFLENKFGREFSEAQVAEAFRSKVIETRGAKHDIAVAVEDSTRKYARQLADELETVFAKAFDDATNIVLCGGAVYSKIVVDELKSRFGNIITTESEHEFCNVKSYDLV